MVIGRPIILHNPSSTGRATLWWVYPPSKQTRRIKPQHQAWINKTGYIDNGIIITHVCAVPLICAAPLICALPLICAVALICAVLLKCSRNYWQSLLSLFNCSGWGNPISAVALSSRWPKNAVTLNTQLNVTVLLTRLPTQLSTQLSTRPPTVP